MNSHKFFW